MREQEMGEIKLHGVTRAGLKNIIDFIYTSRVHLNMANLQDTLEAANFLQVMPVLGFCNQLLSSEVRPEQWCRQGLDRGGQGPPIQSLAPPLDLLLQ